MDSRKLEKIAADLAKRFEQKEFAYWRNLSFPHAFEEVIEGSTIQVEVELLEDEPGYLHISVAVSHDSWLRSFCPLVRDFLISKPK